MSAWKLSFGRSGVRGLSPRPWGTFLGLHGEEDGGCLRLLPQPARERGHTRPSVPAAMGEVPGNPEPSQEPEEPRKFLSGGTEPNFPL